MSGDKPIGDIAHDTLVYVEDIVPVSRKLKTTRPKRWADSFVTLVDNQELHLQRDAVEKVDHLRAIFAKRGDAVSVANCEEILRRIQELPIQTIDKTKGGRQ